MKELIVKIEDKITAIDAVCSCGINLSQATRKELGGIKQNLRTQWRYLKNEARTRKDRHDLFEHSQLR